MFGSPAAAKQNVGIQSSWDMMSLIDGPRLDHPRPAHNAGHAEAALPVVPFRCRYGVVPPSGQVTVSAPLSVP